MEPLALVTLLFVMIGYSYEIPMEKLSDVLVYPVEGPSKIQKRDTSKHRSSKSFNEFVEEKLIEHGQALEHLVKMFQKNEDLTKLVIGHLSKNIAKPDLPEKVEVAHHQNRRSYNDDTLNPFLRLGRNIPKYSLLFKDVIETEVKNIPDPTAIIENGLETVPKFMSRRSYGQTVTLPSLQDKNEISPWCSVAILCRRTVDPVCGYDDNFGYGKFDDICHMLQVNCYWKYNFALVPNCRPV